MENNEVKSAVETLGKTFESFKNRVENTAIDYCGGYDDEVVHIHDPVFHDIVDDDGEPMPKEDRQVIIHFSAIIPTNIGGKELLNWWLLQLKQYIKMMMVLTM